MEKKLEEMGGGMETVTYSEYLSEAQAKEAKEEFLAVQNLDDAFALLDKINCFVIQNASSDQKYEDLFNCLSSIRKVAENPDLEKVQALAFLSPTLGLALVGMLVLVGLFSEDELRIAFAEKASLFQKQNENRDA